MSYESQSYERWMNDMAAEPNYEDIINECAETRRDLDVVLHPIYGYLKKVFEITWSSVGFTKSDFKRYADMVYYQGGYPRPDSLPKAQVLADQVAAMIKLEEYAGKHQFADLLKARGIVVGNSESPEAEYRGALTDKEEKALKEAWEGAGIDKDINNDRFEILEILIDKAMKIQKTICEQADTIKVDAADMVESTFKIKKSHFIKAVGLATVKLRKGEGAMAEKVDDIIDNNANLEDAIKPLLKHGE